MFSIVIPLYNKQNSVQRTLESVLTQSYSNFEVIIVDDGSTDESVKRVKEITDSRIGLIQKQNGGVSSARNFGIKESKYRYIAFLDADDIWDSEYLSEQKKLIEDFPDSGMWGCAWGYVSNEIKTQINHLLPPNFRGILTDYFGMKKKSNIFWTSAVVIDKTIFEKIEPFDERIRIGEDLDMWYRIILNFPVVFYNKTLTYYRTDAENSAMDREIPLEYFMPYYLEKYTDYRKENVDFRKFIDRSCLSALFPYYAKNKKNKDVLRVIKLIDFSEQKWTYYFRFRFPKLFTLILKIKGN